MGQFVISIEANGAVSGLQHKPGKGLDLRQLGKAEIQRASEILWDEEIQRWYVEIRRGKYAGTRLTVDQYAASLGTGGKPLLPHTLMDFGPDEVLNFAEYDDAVAVEIQTLDHIRRTEGAAALR